MAGQQFLELFTVVRPHQVQQVKTVVIAHSVEHLLVTQEAMGSKPINHPKKVPVVQRTEPLATNQRMHVRFVPGTQYMLTWRKWQTCRS